MKRSQLQVGEKYVSKDEHLYEVLDLTPGWLVRQGEWVFEPKHEKRYVAGKGMVPYQANTKIKALLLDDEDSTEGIPAALEPRYLACPLSEYEAKQKEWRKEQAAQNKALKGWQAAAKKAGVTADIDLEWDVVQMSVQDFGKLINYAGGQ